MKFPITLALFLAPIALLAQELAIGAAEFVRLTIETSKIEPSGEPPKYYSTFLRLEEGDVAQLLTNASNEIPASGMNGAFVRVALSESGPFTGIYQWDTFVGPGVIRIEAQRASSESAGSFTYHNFAVIRAGSSANPRTDQSGNLVIPEDAAGPVQILLEHSADMITWTNANPGTYDPGEGKRFFRLRAVILN